MNNKLKKDLLIVGISILCIFFIGASVALGSIMSPLVILVLYLIGFNFVLLPIFTNNYYKMYGMDSPGYKSFIPMYNATLSSKPSWAVMSYILIIINILVLILVFNIWIFEVLGDKWFFIVSDGMPLVFMITVSLYYLVTGIGLMTPLLQTKELYIEFFRDSDEVRGGIARFIMKSSALVKYLEVILLVLPIFRIVPMYLGFTRISELKRYKVSFLDFE